MVFALPDGTERRPAGGSRGWYRPGDSRRWSPGGRSRFEGDRRGSEKGAIEAVGVTGQRRRVWPFVIAIGVSLFVGFWGWVYQGYTEDAGFQPTQSWPIGVGGYLLAGVLALLAIRRARPGITNGQLVLVAICLTVALVAAAIGSLDGGNGWNS